MKSSVFLAAALAASALAAPLPSHAGSPSFNLGAVSLYKDRGVDQDGRNESVRPAIQGGVDYDFDSGFYVGNWNSTGRFGDADLEVDAKGGYRAQLSKDLGIDAGYIHYFYPGEGSRNSGEVYAGLKYQRLGFKVYRGVREDVNKNDMYYRVNYAHPLMDKLDVTLGAGYQTYDASSLRNKLDYSVGLDYALGKNLTLSGSVAGANRRHDVDDGSRDARFIVGAGARF
ncbi:putative protein (TIGR02001 family) OS=Castellaniella defragrans OX=75697 GN=HNR28_001161 PE=4 SV=1 [Castellaniella denitrificans]|uniref:TorF family putative porin n=1 Tax=Castellaniella denitrificans TaxID=56119 RepID=UPI001AD5ADF2|nr:hypothetical protein [Burkholderiales bacterium]